MIISIASSVFLLAGMEPWMLKGCRNYLLCFKKGQSFWSYFAVLGFGLLIVESCCSLSLFWCYEIRVIGACHFLWGHCLLSQKKI
ncbi:hypothetical protein L1049_004381 [Liquidambar formosana]|uniref:Uncharacterized protein n=1 Tax=Liquidambar formosana TaxID=63359 RepID=A0AAP0RNX0_LIQFO